MTAIDITAGMTDGLTNELATIAEQLRRSTVQVRGRRSGVGSGVIWSADGLVITNAHVISSAQATVELWDGRSLTATVTAHDPQQDLATLHVEATELPAASINTANLRVGEFVLAVGNPLGLAGALTTGIVHAVDASGAGDRSWVQADIQLAPGNSGGPLANVRGEVIGINTMIVGGLALAISSQTVEQFLRQDRDRPYLGVTLQPVPIRFGKGLGFLLLAIAVGSPAEAAGLMVGDLLVGVGGRFFQRLNDLTRQLNAAQTGDTLALEIIRGGKQMVKSVSVTKRSTGLKAA